MVVHSTEDPLLTRQEGAKALTEAGFPTSPATLATKVSRGGGPRYHLYSGRAIYRWSDLLAWAQARVSDPRSSSSEQDYIGFKSPARPSPA